MKNEKNKNKLPKKLEYNLEFRVSTVQNIRSSFLGELPSIRGKRIVQHLF